MKFVTVKETHYQADLVVLKSRLESEGIEYRFKNELTSQVLNYISSFLVELQVPEEDVPRVMEIMTKTGDLQAQKRKTGLSGMRAGESKNERECFKVDSTVFFGFTDT